MASSSTVAFRSSTLTIHQTNSSPTVPRPSSSSSSITSSLQFRSLPPLRPGAFREEGKHRLRAQASPEFRTSRPQTRCGMLGIWESGVGYSPMFKKTTPPRFFILGQSPASLSVSPSMGEEEAVVVEEKGVGYAVYCRQGKKTRLMEDAYCGIVDLEKQPRKAFFGIFDGHGGTEAAEFASKRLGENIMSRVNNCKEDEVEEAVRDAYLATDSEFLEQGTNSGVCCVSAFIKDGDLVVSNVGDCRAVLSRQGYAEALTVDHRPSGGKETKRVESLGGYVVFRHGAWRVQGTLAVSRAIGDSELKKWVCAEPETKIIKITPTCEFVIMASDGIWEKVTNQQAVNLVRPFCICEADIGSVASACKKLAELAISRGSLDDTSVMIIQIRSFV